MSVKPSDVGRFAVDGSNVDSPSISAPSGALRDTGFPDDYVPPAKEFNYLENLAYRWRKYLSDGAFTGGVTADSLTVSGAFSAPGGITTTTLASSAGVTTTTLVASTSVAAPAVTTPALTTTGTSTLGGNVNVTGTVGITSGSLYLHGAADIKQDGRILVIAASSFDAISTNSDFGSTSTSGSRAFDGWAFGASGEVIATVPLNVGDRVVDITHVCMNHGLATLPPTVVTLYTQTIAGGRTTIATHTGAAGPANTTWSETYTFNHTLVRGECVTISIANNDPTLEAALIWVELTYDHL